jgi:hypothetical protein
MKNVRSRSFYAEFEESVRQWSSESTWATVRPVYQDREVCNMQQYIIHTFKSNGL